MSTQPNIIYQNCDLSIDSDEFIANGAFYTGCNIEMTGKSKIASLEASTLALSGSLTLSDDKYKATLRDRDEWRQSAEFNADVISELRAKLTKSENKNNLLSTNLEILSKYGNTQRATVEKLRRERKEFMLATMKRGYM